MSLQERLSEDLKDAMRQKDETRRSTIRFIRAAVQNQEIDKREALTDDEIIGVLSRLVRQHQESIAEFKKADRHDLVGKEEAELRIIREYMPEQISEEDLAQLAREAISQTGASGPGDMGKVMGILMPQVRGRADGSQVSSVVRQLLSA